MNEILPGLYHWTTLHERIHSEVHSYYVEGAKPAYLIDPLVPTEGTDWFKSHALPENVYLTNRHHYRHSNRFEKGFNSKVWCHKDGLHEFKKGEKVQPFEHGALLPGGVAALAIGVLCPEETALYLRVGGGVLAFGDAIIRRGKTLGFVPDEYIGDDPENVKRGLKSVFRGLLDKEFDHLLFAHGEPLVGGGKAALRKFAESPTG